MANIVYPSAKEAFLSGDIDLAADDIKVLLLAGYTYSAADVFITDLSTDDTFASGVLASKTVAGGVFDAADLVISAVPAAQDAFLDPTDWTDMVLYKDTGTPATSPVIAHLDSATGLPFLGDGSDVTVAWDSGSSKIFAL